MDRITFNTNLIFGAVGATALVSGCQTKTEPTSETVAVKSWAPWLSTVDIPKLCFYVTPGVAIKERDVKVIKEIFKNTEMIQLGDGLHFIQEDYPHEIGEALSAWYNRI